MTDLESGLFLPIRFYNASTEQDRYKRHSTGVALTEYNYPYVDCVSLAPFQLSYTKDVGALTVEFNAYCADNNTQISLTFNAAEWQEYISSNGTYYLSYLGEGDFTGELSNGTYYFGVAITFTDSERIEFYSDLFRVKNCDDTAYEIEEYRVHSPKVGELKRAIDATDLRITKQ